MAEIRELGESLLARAKQRNEDQFKRSRKEAYKIALLTAGGGLLNKQLQNKTNDFLNSEQMLAARAKQRAGYLDAQRYVSVQDSIDASGMNSVEYFERELLPQVRERALEQVREQELDQDSLSIYVRDQARKLAEQKAQSHDAGYRIAQTVESPEDFAAFQQMAVERRNSNANRLLRGVGRLFGGKSQAEIDQEIITTIENSDMIRRAETTSLLRRTYAQTGDLSLAVRAAEAVERGDIEAAAKTTSLNRVGEGKWIDDRWGNSTYVVPYEVMVDGQVQMKDGKPHIIYHRAGGGGISNTLSPDLVDALDSVTDGEIETQATTRQFINRQQPEQLQEAVQQYVIQTYGTDTAGNPNYRMLDQTLAAHAILDVQKYGESENGMKLSDYQRLQAQMLYNDLSAASPESGGFLGFGGGPKFGIENMGLNKLPESIARVIALGDLEGSYNPDGTFVPGSSAITFTSDDLINMIGTLNTDLARLTPEEQDAFWTKISSEPDKYFFLMGAAPTGDTPAEVIQETIAASNSGTPILDQAIAGQEVGTPAYEDALKTRERRRMGLRLPFTNQ